MQKEFGSDIKYVGVDDVTLDLFENQYPIPKGVSYNSYVIMDDVVAVMDTVDERGLKAWEEKLLGVLSGRAVDFLVLQHLEPDHAGGLVRLLELFPQMVLVGNEKTFKMLSQFFALPPQVNTLIVREGDKLSLGRHVLHFFMAPMVHWPEVMVTYDSTEKVLFSADAFGKFGALSLTEEEGWACEARRYYFNIVGKYGAAVQTLLQKMEALEVEYVCPLHGPVLRENLKNYVNLYKIWSSFLPESKGVVIAYASIYGNTARVAKVLADILEKKGIRYRLHDLVHADMSQVISDAFRYDKLVLAASSYDGGVFPAMEAFLHHLKSKAFQKRKVALIENGSWQPSAARTMRSILESMKDLEILEPVVTVFSALKKENVEVLEELAEHLQ